jgi:hypothetical protein
MSELSEHTAKGQEKKIVVILFILIDHVCMMSGNTNPEDYYITI